MILQYIRADIYAVGQDNDTHIITDSVWAWLWPVSDDEENICKYAEKKFDMKWECIWEKISHHYSSKDDRLCKPFWYIRFPKSVQLLTLMMISLNFFYTLIAIAVTLIRADLIHKSWNLNENTYRAVHQYYYVRCLPHVKHNIKIIF